METSSEEYTEHDTTCTPKDIKGLTYWPDKGLYFGVDVIRESSVTDTEKTKFWTNWYEKRRTTDIFKVMSGLISFMDCLENQNSFGPDEDLYVSFLLIDKDSKDPRIKELLKLRQSDENKHEEENQKLYPFTDTPNLTVVMVTGVAVQQGKIYSPTGIAKSDWAYRVCSNLETITPTQRLPHQKLLFGIAIPFHKSTAVWVHTQDPDVQYLITRPTPDMTAILKKKIQNVSVGSTEDRSAVESIINQNVEIDPIYDPNASLQGYRDVSGRMKASGEPILDNEASDGTWKIKSVKSNIPKFFLNLFSLGNRFIPIRFPLIVIHMKDLITESDTPNLKSPFLIELNKFHDRLLLLMKS